MKLRTLFYLLLSLFAFVIAEAQEITGRFAPPAGKVLVFAGQDNESVGGTETYQNGYVENIGIPGGITHYVYFSEGWTNAFDRTFPIGEVAGLNKETEWASGPMHQKAYLDSPTLDPCVMHLSIAMEGNNEDKVADGSFDHLIAELVTFIKEHPDHPFLIRPGYEFDGSWNKYDPENFKKAFRRIVDALRAEKLPNFAMVFASSSDVKPGQFEEYDPGGEYYEWVGYSWWGGEKDAQPALDYARKVGKPVFIAEATPRGHFFDEEDHEEIWNGWFTKFFNHIDENIDVIRAVSYINADWDSQDMWDGWGQTKIETAPYIKKRWLEKLAEPRFINAADEPFKQIGFPAEYAEPKKPVAPYNNATLSVEMRVADLLGRMTIEEKVGQITGWWHYDERKMQEEGKIFTPEFFAEKCPNGIGELGPLHNLSIEEDAKLYAAVQTYFRKQTRLGIPAILHDEAAHGFMKFEANSFPAPVGIACSWNPKLITEVYTKAAQEARSRGVSHVLSPVVDVSRDLRWGRVDETLGEDPFLVGRLGAAMVEGLQGSTDGSIAAGHVAATLKHFAGYAATEGGRNRAPYLHGPRQLLDNQVEPFRHVIRTAKPSSVMAAYNEVDGLPCHINPWILNDVLRGNLGFEGLIVSDYQGIDLIRRYQKIGISDADVARMALEAGLQLELPNNFGFQHLPKMVKEGAVDIARIDDAVRAVLDLKFRLGLFEAPDKLDVKKAKALATSEETRELARKAARQSIVLLKNEGNLLPLKPGAHESIAVIGPNADVCRLGNYSGRPLKTVSLLQGVRSLLGDSAKVTHAEGCKIAHNDTGDSYANWRYVDEVEFATLEDNQPLIEEAVAVAEKSDLVILALGENILLGREAWGENHIGDRTTFDLTESQQALARAVIATGKPVVLFLNNGRPVALHDLGDGIPAILTAHYAGQETGTAAAGILFGKTNPSGKLTVSWPRSVGHIPSHYSQHGSARVFDYADSSRSAAYPFGHGLSYTTFAYGKPELSGSSLRAGESVEVKFDVTNAGERAGTEIAQLYVSGEEFSIARPALELKGFARIFLKPAETKKVTITLEADDLHFHDKSLNRVLPKGKYLIRVGGSSTKLSDPVSIRTQPGTPMNFSGAPSASGAAPRKDAMPPAEPKPLRKGKHPNVLFVAIDDLRPELGTYGTKCITPNIDKLAETGIRFDRAYCQQAVCGASRLSLMGGLYPTLTREQSFHVSGWRERHPDLVTMNQHFGSQGYETIGLGKIYHGHTGKGIDHENWSRWINVNAPDYALPENVENLKAALEANEVGTAHDPPKGPLTEMADVHDYTYIDGRRSQEAVATLKKLSEKKDQPFFFAVGLSKPHLPFVAPKKYWDLYNREDFAMPPNQKIPPGYPEHAANLAAHEMHKYSDYEGELPTDFSDELNRRLLHGYAAATSYADACFGRIMDTLEKTGLAENTIVVLWGDHGFKLGDHSTWVKHTNFECDTRVPLIVRDPRIDGGKSTPRLVELIDLYPTLCDLTGIPTPSHCQGRSFAGLLTDPEAGHRIDAYSTYPAWKSLGHSIRIGNFRYTEWHEDETGEVIAKVLTNLKDDPGEETNVIDEPKFSGQLAVAQERLALRISQSTAAKAKSAVPETAPISSIITINPSEANLRQTIDGFGGSIAFWGTHADDEALGAAIEDLDVSIVRAQGEVSPAGVVDHNRDILQRAMKLNPDLQILLTFWQPRSAEHLEKEYWLDLVEEQYELKPDLEEQWADELVARIQQYLDWGINVTAVGIQNESNWSHPGTQTCRWDPERLGAFITERIKPRLEKAGLADLDIAAPDLAYVGHEASEVKRFLPTLTNPDTDIAAYHMYDSYGDDMDGSLEKLVQNTRELGRIRHDNFPKSRLWMTETTGAQWNSDEWHTYGWTREMTEHDKAIKAARYIHTTLADAEANAFLWWGLVYSLAPEKVTNPDTRQKHRDEGLVLVSEVQENARQKFLERTRKFYTFRQYSNFIKPGYQRVELREPEALQVSAFQSPDRRKLAVVAVNDTDRGQMLTLEVPLEFKVEESTQTDQNRSGESVDAGTILPPRSVRTVVFQKQ
ncbi:MAG: glycoside hydrolase family 3 N-terminal domain-containing protein [Verrucomicrobiales bacterium]